MQNISVYWNVYVKTSLRRPDIIGGPALKSKKKIVNVSQIS